MTELRINGYRQVEKILKLLEEFLQFKKIQATTMLEALHLIQNKVLVSEDYEKLIDYMLIIQNENYKTKKKRTKEEFMRVLGLTP